MKTAVHDDVRSVVTALQRATNARKEGRTPAQRAFVTISRQAGAGGKTLGVELAKALNENERRDHPWIVWDHELVEKVAADHQIPSEVLEAFEAEDHGWLREFVESLSTKVPAADFKTYRRLALTLRAIARAGHAVVVGRGGAFITAGMSGGVHVRLVAPVDFRVRRVAKRHGLTIQKAAARVKETDRRRDEFYRRYWPNKELTPEAFTVTFNTAEMTDQQIVSAVIPMVTPQEAGAPTAAERFSRRGVVRSGAM